MRRPRLRRRLERQVHGARRGCPSPKPPTASYTIAPTVPAPEFGSPDEAVAMVRRVQKKIAREGFQATYRAINNKAKEFGDRDLYPFIIEFNGVEPANGGTPEVINKYVMDLTDQDGKFQGLIAVARERGSGWYDYRWPNPKTKIVEYKRSYVERITGYVRQQPAASPDTTACASASTRVSRRSPRTRSA